MPEALTGLVRPFVLTNGRTRVGRTDLRVESIVVANGSASVSGQPEHAAIVAAAASPVAVAEVAARLDLALGVATVLVGDLLDSGALTLHQTDPVDIELSMLTRMIDKVRAL